MKKTLLLITLLYLPFILWSQEANEEFVRNNKIFKTGSSWFTLAYGKGYSFKQKDIETNGDVSFNMRLNKIYLQLGYHMSSNDFFLNYSSQRLNDIHLGLGYRIEKDKSNIAAFIGPSYAYGNTFYGTDSLGRNLTLKFSEPGIYTSIQYTYKIFYDIGMGLTLYACINKSYPLVGLQAHIYFSGAYKGNIKK